MTSKRRAIWQWALSFWVVTTVTSMAGMSIGGAVFIGTSFALLLLDQKERLGLASFKGLWFPLATIALMTWCVVSMLVAWILPPLGIPLDNFSELKKFHYFFYPFAVAMAILGTSNGEAISRHGFWRVLEVAVILISIVTICQFWGAYIFPEPWLKSRFFRELTGVKNFHGQGIMMFHLSFASALCFSVAYFFARLVWRVKLDGRYGKILLWLTPILSAIAVFYSYSRIAWVALALILVTICFLRKPRWGILALAGVAVTVVSLWAFDLGFQRRMIYSIFSLRGRVIVWNAALEMVRDRPITGVGHGKTGTYSEAYALKVYGKEQWFASHAHNNFLEILASTGAVGLMTFLFWWGLLFFYAVRNFQRAPPEEKWLCAGVLAALIAFHINGVTQVNFYDGKSQHSLMLWAGIVLAQYIRFGRNSPQVQG